MYDVPIDFRNPFLLYYPKILIRFITFNRYKFKTYFDILKEDTIKSSQGRGSQKFNYSDIDNVNHIGISNIQTAVRIIARKILKEVRFLIAVKANYCNNCSKRKWKKNCFNNFIFWKKLHKMGPWKLFPWGHSFEKPIPLHEFKFLDNFTGYSTVKIMLFLLLDNYESHYSVQKFASKNQIR